MSLWQPAPDPPTPLGRYRVLSPLAGVRVSPLCLGAMSIGDKWEDLGMGAMNKDSSFKLLDAYYEAGGNLLIPRTINESSEELIGKWMEQRGLRDQLVVATKYTTNFKVRAEGINQKINYTGNNAKSLHISVEASLKKLRTDYIDILYLHWWDYDTSVEEVMNNLHNLVALGKVLYLGISDTPAWVVAKANQYAKDHGKTPFCIYQGAWNVMARSFERDIIPMARSEGLALAPWNVLAAGKLRSDAEEERRKQSGEKGRMLSSPEWERNEEQRKMSTALEKVAKEVGTEHITAVALAYLLQKMPYVFPIIGGRKVEHLHGNIEALKITLTPQQIEYLEDVIPFDPGFPNTMIGNGTTPNKMLAASGKFDRQPYPQPIQPAAN